MKNSIGSLGCLIFVRHGKRGQDERGKDLDTITDRGVRQSRAAGEWLRHRRLVPDAIVRTRADRTRTTAEALLEGLELDLPIRALRPGAGWAAAADPGRAAQKIDARLADWLPQLPLAPGILLFVGHRTSQKTLAAALGSEKATLSRVSNGGVIVCRRALDRWVLEAWRAGGD